MLRRVFAISGMLIALTGTAAMAQAGGGGMGGQGGMGGMGQGGGPQQFAQRRMQALLNGITLTPAQQKSVDSVQQAFQAKMPAFTPGQPMSDSARMQMRAMRTQQDSTIRALLTPDQQATWDRNVANMPQRGGRGPGGE